MITKDMTIAELIHKNELIAHVLQRQGMHCVSCHVSQDETLEEACMVHGIDCQVLVDQLNEIFA